MRQWGGPFISFSHSSGSDKGPASLSHRETLNQVACFKPSYYSRVVREAIVRLELGKDLMVERHNSEMTRDEVLYQQIEDARGLYHGLAIVYALATLAAIIMGIICPFVGKAGAIIQLAGFAIGLGTSCYLSWSQYKDYANALEEIGPDPTGVDTCRTYSKETAEAIALARLSEKDLFQQWIAYGILTITLLGFGIFLLALYFLDDFTSEMVLLGCGGLLLAGGALLAFLTVKAFHGWRAVRRLPKDVD